MGSEMCIRDRLDTCGAGLGYLLTGMTTRQSMWFFTLSTIKTVDDHCGYAFPWDPLQHLTSNNAGYHDVHHQSWGIKTNFSQPFFTFWDSLLGTKWTGGDVSARYERARLAAQKKVDADATITASTHPQTARLSRFHLTRRKLPQPPPQPAQLNLSSNLRSRAARQHTRPSVAGNKSSRTALLRAARACLQRKLPRKPPHRKLYEEVRGSARKAAV